ncbi:MAG: beta-class carbonic anhydrase [Marmoricola sp.]
MTDDFDDLLSANRTYADEFALKDLPGVAGRGLAIVTCMDSRIDPLAILGLRAGDAKVVRNPGGRVDDTALESLVLACHLLQATRIMIVPHTRCAMASSTLEQVRERVGASAGQDVAWQPFGMVADQEATLREDVHRVTSHPLIPDSVAVAGFRYDVDTGLLDRLV